MELEDLSGYYDGTATAGYLTQSTQMIAMRVVRGRLNGTVFYAGQWRTFDDGALDGNRFTFTARGDVFTLDVERETMTLRGQSAAGRFTFRRIAK